jgi:hypothetical protein
MASFILLSWTLCVSPSLTLSFACGVSLSYRSVLVFEFVLALFGYCSTLRVAEREKGRTCGVRSVLEDRVAKERNMALIVIPFACVCVCLWRYQLNWEPLVVQGGCGCGNTEGKGIEREIRGKY